MQLAVLFLHDNHPFLFALVWSIYTHACSALPNACGLINLG